MVFRMDINSIGLISGRFGKYSRYAGTVGQFGFTRF